MHLVGFHYKHYLRFFVSFCISMRTEPVLPVIFGSFLFIFFFPQILFQPNAATVDEDRLTGTGRRTLILY